jgi:L-fuconolactonase
MMRVDAHLHLWAPACGFDNRPVADHVFYRRDFLMTDVGQDLAQCRIAAAVLVQTCPQASETQWLLDLARNDARIAGVTGWVDLDTPGVDWAPLVDEKLLVGIRAQLRRVADDAFVLRPQVLHNIAAALDAGLSVTMLAEPRHYAFVERALEILPPGPVLFNHLCMPTPQTDRSLWRNTLARLVRRPQTYVQLSGLPFLFGSAWRSPDVQSMLDDAFDSIGPQRLVFASDWPMLLRFATYGDWVDCVEAFLARRAADAATASDIFGGNLARAMPRLSPPFHTQHALQPTTEQHA